QCMALTASRRSTAAPKGWTVSISATCSLGATTPSVDHVEIVNNGDCSPSRRRWREAARQPQTGSAVRRLSVPRRGALNSGTSPARPTAMRRCTLRRASSGSPRQSISCIYSLWQAAEKDLLTRRSGWPGHILQAVAAGWGDDAGEED